MRHALNGHATFHDMEHSLILGGGLALRSDGRSRSEIDVTNFETGAVETLVFAAGSTWVPVFQLIQVIGELFTAGELVVTAPASDTTCPACGGTGMYEDDDGNWRDCRQCVR